MDYINEYVDMFFIVLPLGILLIGDKERLASLQLNDPPATEEEMEKPLA